MSSNSLGIPNPNPPNTLFSLTVSDIIDTTVGLPLAATSINFLLKSSFVGIEYARLNIRDKIMIDFTFINLELLR